MSDIVKKTGLQLGIVLGTVLIVVSAYIYFVDLKLFTDVWIGMTTALGMVVFGCVAALISRKKLGGYITFRESFSTYFITILIGRVMVCLFSVIVSSFVLTPETKVSLKQQMYDFNVKLMNQNLAPKEETEKMVKSWPQYDPFTPSEIITPAVKYLLRDCLIGFLAALVIRNKRALI
ncbi:DUF4199 domain-containing protein [Flavobacterium sp.]|uniref:DUF4199 domain-containing protein n=1 Tax=Flavobacterium sp. TaxID=239 RepID=UPI002636400D|nr:DUF4199 domain-containing protein [Flavobacterium sp.]